MEIRLTKQELKDIHSWVLRNPMKYENAPAAKQHLTYEQRQYLKKVESFMGRSAELAVYKAFGGHFIKEGNGNYGGDWYRHNPTKPWDIKNQDIFYRDYPLLSIDLTEWQLQRYESHNCQGIIFCTSNFNLDLFLQKPIITITAWAELSSFRNSPAKPGKHSIDWSIYEGSKHWRTDFENL